MTHHPSPDSHHPGKSKDHRKGHRNGRGQNTAPDDWFTKGISILLQNPATARSTPHLEVMRYDCPPFSCPVCRAKAVFDIAPGGPERVFDTDLADFSVVQIKRRHLIAFKNPAFQRPFIKAWTASDDELCHVNCTQVLDDYPLNEGESYQFALDGHLYTVTRNSDKPDFKYFTLELATDL